MQRAVEMAPWLGALEEQIRARNSREMSPFQGIIKSHLAIRTSMAAVVAEKDAAVARAWELEKDKKALIEDLSRASVAGGFRSGREKELEDRCAVLQQQLNASLVQQSEFYRLQLEVQQQAATIKNLIAENGQITSQLSKVRTEFSDLHERYLLLRREREALAAENELQSQTVIKTREEHDRFLKEILAAKQREMQLQEQIFALETEVAVIRRSAGCGSDAQATSQHTDPRFLANEGDATAPYGVGCFPPSGTFASVDSAHDGECYSIAVTENSRHVWTGGNDKLLRQWDAGLQPINRLHSFSGALSLHTVHERLISGGSDSVCRIWDLQTNRCVAQLTGHSEKVVSVSFNLTGKEAYSASSDRTIRCWDVAAGALLRSIILPSTCNDLCISNDRVCSAHHDGFVRFWDPRSGKLSVEINAHDKKAATCVRVTNNDFYAVTCGRDNTVRILDTRSLQTAATFSHERFAVSSSAAKMCLSPDDSFCAAGNTTGGLILWPLHSKDAAKAVLVDGGHRGGVNAIAWSPDGRGVFSVGQDRRLLLWR
jgi:autophagy-related protein 16